MCLFGAASLYALTCEDGNSQSHFLRGEIGLPGSSISQPYLLPCDTMEIHSGDTCFIHPGVKLHFDKIFDGKNVVLVQGVLIAEGSETNPVYFSGSLEEYALGLRPGPVRWGGIRIGETGSLRFRNVRLFNADTVIVTHSKSVTLEHVFVKGCLRMQAATGAALTLGYDGEDVEAQNGEFAADSASTVTAASGATGHPMWKSPWLWGGVGAGMVLAGGGVWWMLSASGSGAGVSPPTPLLFADDPTLPQAGPRKP